MKNPEQRCDEYLFSTRLYGYKIKHDTGINAEIRLARIIIPRVINGYFPPWFKGYRISTLEQDYQHATDSFAIILDDINRKIKVPIQLKASKTTARNKRRSGHDANIPTFVVCGDDQQLVDEFGDFLTRIRELIISSNGDCPVKYYFI